MEGQWEEDADAGRDSGAALCWDGTFAVADKHGGHPSVCNTFMELGA